MVEPASAYDNTYRLDNIRLHPVFDMFRVINVVVRVEFLFMRIMGGYREIYERSVRNGNRFAFMAGTVRRYGSPDLSRPPQGVSPV